VFERTQGQRYQGRKCQSFLVEPQHDAPQALSLNVLFAFTMAAVAPFGFVIILWEYIGIFQCI
jgi:hypothetical protein